MKRGRLYMVALCLAGCIMGEPQAMGQTVAQQRCDNFGKGMNLSNWLEAYWQVGYPTPNGYTRNDLQKMKDAGITSIRLPIGFASVTDTLAPYNVDTTDALFARVDTVIKWCAELNMNLIIDNHHNWDIFNQNWRGKVDRFSHMWSVVSNHYKNLDPNRYTFELLNEPAFGISMDSLKIVFDHAIDSIRQHTTAHTLIVSPNFSSNGAAFANLSPWADTNLIYTWHSYDPYQFTHQGFSWAQPQVPMGETFPGSFDQDLYNAWHTVVAWQNTYNKPVFLGEFGTGVFGDATSRCNWLNVFGSKIDSFHMAWFYWDWRWDFSLFNSNVISEDSVVPCFKHSLHLYGDTLTTAIQNVTLEKGPQFFLYPNPTTGNAYCNIALAIEGDAEVSISDITGRRIFYQRFYATSTLPVQTLQKGIYLVGIKQGDSYSYQKLICN